MADKLPALLIDSAGREVSLVGENLSIGRAEDNDVALAQDRRVSRRHAELHREGAHWVLHDLDSTNGTFINEQRLTAPRPLHDGDVIGIGEATFTFSDPEATINDSAFPLLVYDARAGELWVDRQPVPLSAKELALFHFLYQAEGRICTKDEIGRAVWPEYQGEVFDYQIESLMKRLREKLEPDPREPVLLRTVRGRGYRLVRS
jgi:DNA-binding response OmpR family regulator